MRDLDHPSLVKLHHYFLSALFGSTSDESFLSPQAPRGRCLGLMQDRAPDCLTAVVCARARNPVLKTPLR